MKPLLFLALASSLMADGPGVMPSHYIQSDFALTADPNAAPWKGVAGVIADKGPRGEAVPGHRTEIRSRWTAKNVYFLFTCPYESLYLKPDPAQKTETNRLWNWDVAEVFVGSDFQNIKRYKEFEISPQGEWVDLDIDRDKPVPEGGWAWNSGFESKSRIDHKNKIWYGEMRIPIDKIDTRRPASGLEMRLNLYRCQGSGPDRKYIAWQPTNGRSFHVPEAFGRLRLVGK
jgi:hypothetical protein